MPMYTYKYICMSLCIYLHIYMYMSIYHVHPPFHTCKYTHIHIYIQTHAHTFRFQLHQLFLQKRVHSCQLQWIHRFHTTHPTPSPPYTTSALFFFPASVTYMTSIYNLWIIVCKSQWKWSYKSKKDWLLSRLGIKLISGTIQLLQW